MTLVAFVAMAMMSHAQVSKPIAEQRRFSRATKIDRPVVVPPDVLKLVLSTKEAKEGLSRATETQRQNPAQLFRASEIHLHDADEVELIVEGIPPMASGDHEWFWVVRPQGKKPRLALFAGGTTLEVQDSRTNSYRDIWSIWSAGKETLTSIFKFSGKKYAFHKVVNGKAR